MPRTAVTKTPLVGPYPALPVTATSLDVAFAAADVGNSNQFVASGNDLLLVWNSGGSPYTFTVNSVADGQNRTGDITTYSVAAGVISAIRLQNTGWRQTDGNIYIAASNAAVKFAVIPL